MRPGLWIFKRDAVDVHTQQKRVLKKKVVFSIDSVVETFILNAKQRTRRVIMNGLIKLQICRQV